MNNKKRHCQRHEKSAQNIVRENPSALDVKDIKVSCKVSWSKRAFTAHFVFVSVIEFTIGMVIVFVVLSQWGRVCTVNTY